MGKGADGRQEPLKQPAAAKVVPPGKRKKAEPIEGVDITEEQTLATLLVCVFGTVAMLTGHSWWEKTPQDVRPISEPLSRIIRDRVPRKTLEECQKLYDPIALLIGLAIVVGPLVALELETRRRSRGGGAAPSEGGGPGRSGTGPGGASGRNGNDGQSVSASYPEAVGRTPAF